jgi:hypothetical protein
MFAFRLALATPFKVKLLKEAFLFAKIALKNALSVSMLSNYLDPPLPPLVFATIALGNIGLSLAFVIPPSRKWRTLAFKGTSLRRPSWTPIR